MQRPDLVGKLDPGFAADLQKAWDRTLEASPILLVCVGSDVRMMEALVGTARNPLTAISVADPIATVLASPCLIRHNHLMNAAELIRRSRRRHGISQRSLALRAGTDQAAISRIERGEVSPSVETVERLLAAMGERLRLEAEPFQRDHDPLHVRATLQRAPAERLRLAISWNRLAGRLTEAGRRAHAG